MNKQKLLLAFIFLFIVNILLPEICFAYDVKKISFDNGLTLIYKHTKHNEIVAINLFIKSGSWYEDESNSGITNFIQRLLLKGTKTKTSQELALEIESMGGIINTDTADDYAEITLVITKNHLNKGIEILYDIVQNPSFPNEEIEKERNIILAQIKSKQDVIFEVAYDLFNKSVYGKYPYTKPVLGYEETIPVIKREDLISFHKRFYVPANMVLVVVGNVKEKRLIKKLEKIFNSKQTLQSSYLYSQISAQDLDNNIYSENLPSERILPYKQTYIKKFKQAYLMLGYLLPEGASPDYPTLKVINGILGGGMGSRLFVNLRDKEGLAYEIGSFYPTRKFKSKFVIYLGLDAKNLEKAKEKIIDEIQKLRREKISEEELNQTKNYLKGTFILDHQTNQRQAWYLGWYEIIGKGYLYDTIYLKELEKITSEDIIKTSQKYFKDTNWIVIQITPEEK